MEQTTVYIAAALTYATEEYKQAIADFKKHAKEFFDVKDFLGLGKAPPPEVYRYDMDLISRSQFITAFCDLPSTGEGFEIAAMLFEFKCPVLAVAQHESKVSDFIEGVQHHLFEFERYTMMSDALDMMREFETRRLIQIQQQYLPLFGPPKPARPIVATLAQGGEV